MTRVYREVAELSTRVHWTHEEILNLDHADRRHWLEEILRLDEHNEPRA